MSIVGAVASSYIPQTALTLILEPDMSIHSLSHDGKLSPALRMLQSPRRRLPITAPPDDGWLELLARWADRHPPKHRRLGSWMLVR